MPLTIDLISIECRPHKCHWPGLVYMLTTPPNNQHFPGPTFSYCYKHHNLKRADQTTLLQPESLTVFITHANFRNPTKTDHTRDDNPNPRSFSMRLSRSYTWCAALSGLFATTNSLSIHGHKRNHNHALRHLGKKAARSAAYDASPGSFSIEFINNIDSNNVHTYIVTNSVNSDQAIFITADGEVYKPVAYNKGVATPIPKSSNCGIPLGSLGSTLTITMPVNMIERRVYMADGELDIGVLQAGDGSTLQMPAFQNRNDPNYNISFGFVEANQPDKCIWANPTYVDFVGLPLAMDLIVGDTTPNVSSVPRGGIETICNKLKKEKYSDGYPWSDLCINDDNGSPLRVLSPQHNPSGFADYFDKYIDQVWAQLANGGIKFDLQDGSDLVSCSFQDDSMTCDRTGKPFPKPTSADIWGCNSGPFASTTDECYNKIGGRLCAAFHRATLLLPGGAIQPNQSIDKYYPLDYPHNKYARIVHEVSIDHNGYTFPYDDVKPNFLSEVSGTISGDNPSALKIYVGGRDSGGSQQGYSAPNPPNQSSRPGQSASSVSSDEPRQSSVATKASPTTQSQSSQPLPPPDSPTSPSPSSSNSQPFPGPSPTEPAHSFQKTNTNDGAHAPTDIATKNGQPAEIIIIETAIVTTVVTETTVCIAPATFTQ